MTSAEKKLQVINLSLLHLGLIPITQTELDDESNPSAEYANEFWDPSRDDVLGESNWPFANATEVLSAVDDVEDCEWDFIYTYPTSAVSSMWSVFDEGSTLTKEQQKFTVKYLPSLSNKFIFSNLENAIAEYTYKVTDPLIWSNKFILAMSYRLSAMLAIPLTKDPSKATMMLTIFGGIIGEEKRIGASEKMNNQDEASPYKQAR